MREFIIDFTADVPIVPGTAIGRQGENNATALKIKIPDEMLNNEAVELISLAAQIGAGYVARSELIAKAETVTVKLDSRMTAVNSLSIQLEGYDSTKSLLVKSAKIDNLIFEKSVTGEVPELEGNAGVVADIAANTAARHTHENAETLNKLGETNGSLTYDGKAVGGGKETNVVILTAQEWDIESSMNPETCTFVFAHNTDKIPENAEIANVEIKVGTDDGGNPIWRSVKDSFFDSNDRPFYYYSNRFIKQNFTTFGDGYILFSVYSPIFKSDFISELEGYVFTDIRVRYYI